MTQTYRFTPGFRPRSVKDAAVLNAELARIKEADDGLTSEGVFEASRPKDAPLHGEFIWDGKAAVRELGLIRARQLIRAVVVVDERQEEPPRRVYVHLPSEDKAKSAGTYERIDVVVQHVDLYETALANLQRKFDAAAEALEELRRAAQGTDNADRLAAIGLAVQGFGAVREALAILK